MRILHVVPSLAPVHGGPSWVLPVMERALSALDVTVETATTDDDGPGQRVDKPLGVPLSENGATRRYFAKQSEFYKLSLPMSRWLRGAVRQYDLIHVHALFSHTSVAAARIARRRGLPYVIRPLGVLRSYGMTERRPMLKALSLRFLEGPLLSDAAAVQFTSEIERREAEALGISCRPAVIPLGVELPEDGSVARFLARHPQARDRRRLLFLSRLDAKKNLQALLHALACLKTSHPDLLLIVGGSGTPAYEAMLRALADRLHLSDRILWLGFVTGKDKADALAAADLFVLPSHSENFGIAVAEALATGLPCVLGEGVAIAPDVVEAGAGLAVPSSADALADAIVCMLDSPDRLAGARVRARQLAARRFTAAAMGRALLALYEDTLAGRPRHA